MLVDVDVMGSAVVVDVPLGCSPAELRRLVADEAGLGDGDDVQLTWFADDGGCVVVESHADIEALHDGCRLQADPSPRALACVAFARLDKHLLSNLTDFASSPTPGQALQAVGGDGAACARHIAALFPSPCNYWTTSLLEEYALLREAPGSAECLRGLLRSYSVPAKDLQSVAARAAPWNTAAVKELLAAGAKPVHKSETLCPLTQAVSARGGAPLQERVHTAELLLEHTLEGGSCRDPFPEGFTREQRAAVVSEVCRARLPVTDAVWRRHWRPLLTILVEGDCPAAAEALLAPCTPAQKQALLGERSTPSRWGQLPLGAARSLAAVDALCRHGADINAACGDGGTRLLHLAIKGRRGLSLQGLLERGADLHARTDADETVLHFAAEAGSPSLEELLRWCDVNAATAEGVTPLMLAAKSGVFECVVACLRAGASVAATDVHKRTPLHFASSRRIAIALVRAGADLCAPSDFGTPLEAAEQAERAGPVAVLKELLA